MSRIYGEPVAVWLRDTRPTRFVWRSRLYTITAHQAHWTTPTTPSGAAEGSPAEGAGGEGRDGLGSPRPGAGEPEAAGGEEAPRREFWRVEAVAGLGSAPAVYELRHDLRSGAWLLSRAWD